jgi:predicted PurR-regulated permease PerM
MDGNESSLTSPYQQAARTALAAALGLLGLWTVHSFWPALVWACILAIAIWPLYQRARARWRPGRHDILVAGGFTVAIALVFVMPLIAVAVQLGREAYVIVDWVENIRQNGLPPPAWLARLPVGGDEAIVWWKSNLGDRSAASDLLQRLPREDLVTYSRHLGSQLLHRLVLFGFTLLTLFFLFQAGERLSEQMLRVSHRAFGASGERIAKQMVASVHGTVNGLVLVGLGEGVLLGIAYGVSGVPHPTMLGALTAVAAMIPFGAPLVFGIAALLLLSQGSTVAAVSVFLLGVVITFVADHFVRPVLIGGATRLPFLWVLLGLLGGVETWGLLGLFLGPAIMAALIFLWREWTDDAQDRMSAGRNHRDARPGS